MFKSEAGQEVQWFLPSARGPSRLSGAARAVPGDASMPGLIPATKARRKHDGAL